MHGVPRQDGTPQTPDGECNCKSNRFSPHAPFLSLNPESVLKPKFPFYTGRHTRCKGTACFVLPSKLSYNLGKRRYFRFMDEKTTDKRNRSGLRNRRVHMANERTFLAWIRTSIGIMASGLL